MQMTGNTNDDLHGELKAWYASEPHSAHGNTLNALPLNVFIVSMAALKITSILPEQRGSSFS